MTEARLLRRHRAYFHGWAQAFGHHELLHDSPQGLRWLLGTAQIGLMLDPSVRTRLRGGDEEGLGGLFATPSTYPATQAGNVQAVVARPVNTRPAGTHPAGNWSPRWGWGPQSILPPALIDVGTETLRVGRLTLRHCPGRMMTQVRAMLDAQAELHLFESYHLLYPAGTRILTLSRHAPLGLIYRELAPAVIRSAPRATPTMRPLREAACA